jgi:uncharacterized protein YjbI with pentapeptide repeats
VGRHFVPRGARSDGRQLGDFSHAILKRADLSLAWAEKARFAEAQLQGASLHGAQLQGASLDGANLQGASLEFAQLQGASLGGAQLQSASLFGAQLQGAFLREAELQGASLRYAHLQGAFLREAYLQGAVLAQAQLQGADLEKAQLQGASLDGANLQGASLHWAQLQGVSLDIVHGASLDWAQIQGVEPNYMQLQGASFVEVCVWRADARQATWKDTMVARPITGSKEDKNPQCDWTADSFAALKQLIAKEVPEGDNKRAAMERIEQRLNPTKALEGEDEIAKIWAAREHESPTPEVYEKSLAEQWRTTGCAPFGAPYVLRELLSHLVISIVQLIDGKLDQPFGKDSPEKRKLAADFLDKDCAGARGLSDGEIATSLKAIRDRAEPFPLPLPKP